MSEKLKKYVYCDVCNIDQSEREDLSGWLPTSIVNATTHHEWSINSHFQLVCKKCTKEREKDDTAEVEKKW